MDKIPRNSLHSLLFICSLIIHAILAATDTIDASQSIRDGETLVSSGGIFELGFFSPTNSGNRYLGIWYKNISVSTYIWVANRQVPLPNKSGVLRFTQPGNLALFSGTNGTIIWSTNASAVVENPTLQLLDSGNLVIKEADAEAEDFIWQSFDHPTDTYLPGMMSLGWNLVTGVETHLLSWRSNNDPSPGNFTAHVDPSGYPQILIKRGRKTLYRIGPWNGEQFGNKPTGTIVRQTLVMNGNEGRFRDETMDASVVSKVILSWEGELLRQVLNQQTRLWTTYAKIPSEDCDDYNWCGGYGSCNIGNSPHCGCLERFVPKDVGSWNGGDWSNGCVRRIELNCSDDVFLKYSGIKLPDVHNSSVDEQRTSLDECEEECSRNCDCVAYAQLNITGSGSGCLFYHGELIDIRTEPSGGQDLYIRMGYAEREKVTGSKGKKRVILIVSLASVFGTILLCLSLGTVFAKKRKKIKETEISYNGTVADSASGIHGEEAEVPFFSLSAILKATDHFSVANKLGEGGFGPVYKGILEDGQEVAVKRLSETSSQGVDELKNEVKLIAKLQHRNLVKLLGCCILGEENILVYEYMPNSSLDLILFDQTKRALLDWGKSFNIINGIAKGLLYLHQDSRLRIIHRDLKASNILLDANMNPKISDFGLARSFGGNETEAKTQRVVGTYGYMSPEYVMQGLFSIKSDVFSFGVLVLEVVSGNKNRDFTLKDKSLNLIGHAWTLYKEDCLWELVDASLGNSLDISEALRSIHVGLLCVQAFPEDRPSMSSVVFMLGNEVELPEPKQPAFFTERDVPASKRFSGKITTNSANQVTVSLLDGR